MFIVIEINSYIAGIKNFDIILKKNNYPGHARVSKIVI